MGKCGGSGKWSKLGRPCSLYRGTHRLLAVPRQANPSAHLEPTERSRNFVPAQRPWSWSTRPLDCPGVQSLLPLRVWLVHCTECHTLDLSKKAQESGPGSHGVWRRHARQPFFCMGIFTSCIRRRRSPLLAQAAVMDVAHDVCVCLSAGPSGGRRGRRLRGRVLHRQVTCATDVT